MRGQPGRPSLRIIVTGAMMAGLLATGIFAYAERGRLSTGSSPPAPMPAFAFRPSRFRGARIRRKKC